TLINISFFSYRFSEFFSLKSRLGRENGILFFFQFDMKLKIVSFLSFFGKLTIFFFVFFY
ncbi:hypothetical protein C1645_753991, partial [Glomus cerebriforme]